MKPIREDTYWLYEMNFIVYHLNTAKFYHDSGVPGVRCWPFIPCTVIKEAIITAFFRTDTISIMLMWLPTLTALSPLSRGIITSDVLNSHCVYNVSRTRLGWAMCENFS